MDQRVDCIKLYRESPTWQGLAETSRSSTSLPVVGSDSWVHPLCVGRIRVFIHCGTAFAQSARYLVWSHSEAVRLYRSSETNTHTGIRNKSNVNIVCW